MRVESAFVESVLFIGVMALFLVSCADGDNVSRQASDTPSLRAYPYGGRDVRDQQYGRQDRAGNQTQNGLAPYSNCQYTTPC
jgi:hypothetical protein